MKKTEIKDSNKTSENVQDNNTNVLEKDSITEKNPVENSNILESEETSVLDSILEKDINDINIDNSDLIKTIIQKTSIDYMDEERIAKEEELEKDTSPEAMKLKKRKRIIANIKKHGPRVLIYTALSLWMLTTIYPFIWVFINSFRDQNQIINDSFSIPTTYFTFDNYINAFKQIDILRSYMNSLIISMSVVVLTLIVSAFAAFALVRYQFKGKKFVYGLIVACMMIPVFAIIAPLKDIIIKMGLYQTYFGVILPQVAGNIAFTTILLTGFMSDLPLEIEESAYLDGANVFTVLFRLIMPMAKSAFVTAAIFVFLWSYNDLFLQMIIIDGKWSISPVTNILRKISGNHGETNYGLMCSAVSLVAAPVMVVYYALQKHIIKGLTAGAVKG